METSAEASNGGIAQTKLEFDYDSQGRRFKKDVYAWTSGSWELTSSLLFLYDDWNLIGEFDAAGGSVGNLVRSYVWGLDLNGTVQGAGGVGGLIAAFVSDRSFFPAYDGIGNAVAYFQPAESSTSGAWVAEFTYGPVGSVVKEVGEGAASFVYRFSTKYSDSVTGMVAYQQRYFRPETGWISRDPFGEELRNENIYGFVGNNSINEIDVLGLYRSSLQSEPGVAVMAEVGGATAPATLGTAANATISAGTTAVIASALIPEGKKAKDVLTQEQLRQYSTERKAYKKRCGERPPDGLDLCDRIQWLLQRNRDCLRMREEFGRKWYNDNDHEGVNASYRRSIETLQRQFELNCVEEPNPCESDGGPTSGIVVLPNDNAK